MNYIKKMCILRQIRQGFSGDGKALSGLIKIEQYGKNLAVEVSIINFAPLTSGEYYCLLSDGTGKTEMLSLRGKSLFNLLSDLDITEGFCGIICHVKNEVVPIAYGINGNKSYDWKSVLNATLPPVFPRFAKDLGGEIAESEAFFSDNHKKQTPMYAPNTFPPPESPPQAPQNEPTVDEPTLPPPSNAPATPRELTSPTQSYDDETVATQNYYEEKENECDLLQETKQDAHTESANQAQGKETGLDSEANDDAPRVRRTFKTDPDGYYLAVKEEIDRLFRTYPKDTTLQGAFSCSEWVRVKGSASSPAYLVGVLRKDGRVHYICYALATEDKNSPPEEIKNVCSFVPVSVYEETKGFFVIFQSASSGECVRPERA